ncbi:MAG TPA: hypothetical protein VGQ81_17305, partial [Acidobacteriota bacterium]|nr:hypothetical protein [Acidobacteriota bacterium]
MRLARVLGIVFLLFGMTGCISSTTVIKIKPDGSGTVVQTTTMNAKMVAQMKEMMAEMAKAMAGDKPATEKAPEAGALFTESEARGKAAKMGEGVRFVSSEPIKTSEAEGIRAIYAFDDITKLKVEEKPSAPGPVAAQGMAPQEADSSGMTFRFTKQANGNSLLTVLVPEKKGKAESAS